VISFKTARKMEKDLVEIARGRRRAGSVFREHMEVVQQLPDHVKRSIEATETSRHSNAGGGGADNNLGTEEAPRDLLDAESESSVDINELQKEIAQLQVRALMSQQ
jgi:hypothetical protein